MKALEYWAEEYAADPFDKDHERLIKLAYLAGLEKMREMAQGMVKINKQYGEGLAILIGAIGKAEVNPKTGERLDDL